MDNISQIILWLLTLAQLLQDQLYLLLTGQHFRLPRGEKRETKLNSVTENYLASYCRWQGHLASSQIYYPRIQGYPQISALVASLSY